LGGKGASRDLKDRRRQFAGDLVHVGDHQEKPLRRREGRGHGTGRQSAVHRAGSTALRLQFDHAGNRAPDVLLALRGVLIREFTDGGGRRDRIDRDDLAELVSNCGHRFGCVDRDLGSALDLCHADPFCGVNARLIATIHAG